MIDKIYIPTYRRGEQLTYDNLPEKWKTRAVLVVDDVDAQGLEIMGKYPYLICPVQGNIAKTRKWIIDHAYANDYQYIAMFDDDITEFQYSYVPRIIENKLHKPKGKDVWSHSLSDAEFDNMIANVHRALQYHCHGGLGNSYDLPTPRMLTVSARITGNVFYNLSELPFDKIDWTSLDYAEDYYVALQLITMGYPNVMLHRFRIGRKATQAKGGCSITRNLETHNEAMLELQRRFPQYVSCREKKRNVKGEEFNNKRLRITIQWKKAYQDSLKNKF